MAVVCDGISCGREGENASGYVAETMTEWFYGELCRMVKRYASLRKIRKRLVIWMERRNEDIVAYATGKGIKMGTTVAIFLCFNDKCLIANIGDSRIYKIKRRCRLLSKDHTVAPGVLSKCIGVKTGETLDVSIKSAGRGSGFLICSDGFYKQIKEKELEKILCPARIKGEAYIERGLREIGESLQRKGETDNIAAVYVVLK